MSLMISRALMLSGAPYRCRCDPTTAGSVNHITSGNPATECGLCIAVLGDMRILVPLYAVMALVGCSGSSDPGTDDPPVDPEDPTLLLLTPTQHLTRASVALRGIRPSVEQLQAVAGDPSKLPSI